MALNGTNGNDEFFGTIFADEIFGLGGNDLINGSPGADTINGGDDNDAVDYAVFTWRIVHPTDIFGDSVNVDLERTVQSGGFADGDVLIGIENVSGSNEDDTIKGDSGINELFGNGGDDFIEGRDGDDVIAGDGSARFIYGDGNDILDGGAGSDTIFGNEGNDTLIGGTGLNVLDGGSGVDTTSYAASTARMVVIIESGTGPGDGLAFSLDGQISDSLAGIENVTGSNFDDQIVGSSAANVLNGRNGNDTLDGRGGADSLIGHTGLDTATYATSAAGVVVDLVAGTGSGGDASGDTLSSIENLIGSNSADALYGSASGNTLDGGAGADALVGRGGNDVYFVDNAGDAVLESTGEGTDEVRAGVNYALATNQSIETLRTNNELATTAINLTGNNLANLVIGNNGNNTVGGGGGDDTLIGARGADTLNGGSGADRFLWRDVTDGGTSIPTMDLIVDFNPLAGDRIDLADIDADVFASGNQAFTFIGAAGFSGTPGEVNFVHVNGETIIQLQTGLSGDVEMGIRIAGIVTPEASWFVL